MYPFPKTLDYYALCFQENILLVIFYWILLTGVFLTVEKKQINVCKINTVTASIFLWHGELQEENPGEQNGSYSLFSILGSNCNLITLQEFLDRFTGYSCFSNPESFRCYIGWVHNYAILGLPLHCFSRRARIQQQGRSYWVALPRDCTHLLPWHRYGSKANFWGGENSDGCWTATEEERFDTHPLRQQRTICFVWREVVSSDRHLPIWKYLLKTSRIVTKMTVQRRDRPLKQMTALHFSRTSLCIKRLRGLVPTGSIFRSHRGHQINLGKAQ